MNSEPVIIDGCIYYNGARPLDKEEEVEMDVEEFTKMFSIPAETVVMDAGGNMVEIKEEEEEDMEKVD